MHSKWVQSNILLMETTFFFNWPLLTSLKYGKPRWIYVDIDSFSVLWTLRGLKVKRINMYLLKWVTGAKVRVAKKWILPFFFPMQLEHWGHVVSWVFKVQTPAESVFTNQCASKIFLMQESSFPCFRCFWEINTNADITGFKVRVCLRLFDHLLIWFLTFIVACCS